MELGLAGRLALVTGARGIGLACARALAEAGVRLAICARAPASVAQATAQLPGAFGHAADLSDAGAAAAMVDAVERALGPIDILVNAAGAARRTPPDQLTPAAWRAAMDAKFFVGINVIDPVIKRMAARRSGVIVSIIGAGGKVAAPIHLAGGAANAALMLATAGLGNAYAGQGVRVLGINPGPTETERLLEGLAADAAAQGITPQEARHRTTGRIPLGRLATPADIADLVLFLASPRAAYLTGTTVTMDGGQHPVVV